MQEVNPYRLQYIPAQDHSAERYAEMVAPIARMREQQESDRNNAYRNASLARETARDTNADERDRISQEQRAREMLMSDRRQGQREALYGKQEDRRQEEAMFSRNKMTKAEHEALLQELYNALNSPGQDPLTQQNRVKAAQEALKRAGYATVENEDTPNGPTQPPPFQQPAPAVAAPTAPTRPMSPADKGTSAALDQADKKYSTGLGVRAGLPSRSAAPARPKPDAKLDAQLNAADRTYSTGLGVPPWLPGNSPVAAPRVPTMDVAQSNAMLSPGDPLNNIR